MIRVFLIERKFKQLLEFDLDPESSIQTLLYHISLKLKLQNYLDYGLYALISSEQQMAYRQSMQSQNSQQQAQSMQQNQQTLFGGFGGNAPIDQQDSEQLRYIPDIKNTKISDFMIDTNYLAFKQALENDGSINSVGTQSQTQSRSLQIVSFVLKRRLYSQEFIRNIEVYLGEKQLTPQTKTQINLSEETKDSSYLNQTQPKVESKELSELEIKLLFNQISYQNIVHCDYNEEHSAILQASVLECVRLLEVHHQPSKSSFSQYQASLGKLINIHSMQLDIREITSIFPQQLLTYFNKKSIFKKIQAAKQMIQYNIKVSELEKLYLKRCFLQQPQIGCHYFHVQVLGLTDQNLFKVLKKIPKSSLLLVIGPMFIGFAEDCGFSEKDKGSSSSGGAKNHKKARASIKFEDVEDVDVQQPKLKVSQQNLMKKSKSKNFQDEFLGAFKITYSRSSLNESSPSNSSTAKKSPRKTLSAKRQSSVTFTDLASKLTSSKEIQKNKSNDRDEEYSIILRGYTPSMQKDKEISDQHNHSENWFVQEEIIHLINDYLNYQYREPPQRPQELRQFRTKITQIRTFELKLEGEIVLGLEPSQIIKEVHRDVQAYLDEQDFKLQDYYTFHLQGKISLSQLVPRNLPFFDPLTLNSSFLTTQSNIPHSRKFQEKIRVPPKQMAKKISTQSAGNNAIQAYQKSLSLRINQETLIIRLQRWYRCQKFVRVRKFLISQILKVQGLMRGFLVRLRIKKSYTKLLLNYQALMIQKIFRGYLVRKRIQCFLKELLSGN